MVEVVYKLFISCECDPCGSQHPYAQYTLGMTCIALLEWQIVNKLDSRAFAPVRLKFSVYFSITTYFFYFIQSFLQNTYINSFIIHSFI